MSSPPDLTKLVPGFDFLQGLMKSGGAAMPGIGQWIAPTLEPEELQRRIDELRTVQFWLEQNSKLIGTTIQALEVQRMTLATLKGMNLPLAELTQSLLMGGAAVKTASAAASKPPASSPAAAPAPAAAAPAAAADAAKPPRTEKAAASSKAAAAPIDPLQWWGALTQQFTELATKALKDSQTDIARSFAGAAVSEGLKTAGDSIERAMAMSSRAAGATRGATVDALAQAGGATKAAGKAVDKPRSSRAGAGEGRPTTARRSKG